MWIKLLTIYYLVINVLAFLVYFIDKRKAIKKKRRISEKSLLLMGILGGAIGALLSMYLFRHKTKHYYFSIINILSLLLHAFILYTCFF